MMYSGKQERYEELLKKEKTRDKKSLFTEKSLEKCSRKRNIHPQLTYYRIPVTKSILFPSSLPLFLFSLFLQVRRPKLLSTMRSVFRKYTEMNDASAKGKENRLKNAMRLSTCIYLTVLFFKGKIRNQSLNNNNKKKESRSN